MIRKKTILTTKAEEWREEEKEEEKKKKNSEKNEHCRWTIRLCSVWVLVVVVVVVVDDDSIVISNCIFMLNSMNRSNVLAQTYMHWFVFLSSSFLSIYIYLNLVFFFILEWHCRLLVVIDSFTRLRKILNRKKEDKDR